MSLLLWYSNRSSRTRLRSFPAISWWLTRTRLALWKVSCRIISRFSRMRRRMRLSLHTEMQLSTPRIRLSATKIFPQWRPRLGATSTITSKTSSTFISRLVINRAWHATTTLAISLLTNCSSSSSTRICIPIRIKRLREESKGGFTRNLEAAVLHTEGLGRHTSSGKVIRTPNLHCSSISSRSSSSRNQHIKVNLLMQWV
jgi:hypothetical protein